MPVLCDLIGPGAAPLVAETASAIGLPRAAPGGSTWRFMRAALPHSLTSELSCSITCISCSLCGECGTDRPTSG
eukprot:5611525-Prymnesium_polylepis.1